MNENTTFATEAEILAKSQISKPKLVIGYVRVSTLKQSIERQIRNIKQAYPEAQIVQEVYTGTSMDRPKWEKVMRMIRRNQVSTIVFDSVSRMSRNAEEGVKLYNYLYKRGISLIFLKEPTINTDTYRKSLENKIEMQISTGDAPTDIFIQSITKAMDRYVQELSKKQIELAFEASEREVMELRQRTREGMLSAKLRGSQIGRVPGKKYPSKKSFAAKKIIKKRYGKMLNSDIMILAKVTKGTFYKYIREMIEEGIITPNVT